MENQDVKKLDYEVYKAKYNIYNLKEVIKLCEDKLNYIENVFVDEKKNTVLYSYKKIFTKYQNKLKSNKITLIKFKGKLSKKWIKKYKRRIKSFNQNKKIYYEELENIKNIQISLIKILNNMISNNLTQDNYILSYESILVLNSIIDLKFIDIYKRFFKSKFIFKFFYKYKKIYNLIGEIGYSKKMFLNNSVKAIIGLFFILVSIIFLIIYSLNNRYSLNLSFTSIVIYIVVFIVLMTPYYFSFRSVIIELRIQARINRLRKIIDKYSFIHKTNKSKGYFNDIWGSILKKHKR